MSVIKSRLLNQIQLIKHILASNTDIEVYNDLVILSHIVPYLPENTLVESLQFLKQYYDSIHKTP